MNKRIISFFLLLIGPLYCQKPEVLEQPTISKISLSFDVLKKYPKSIFSSIAGLSLFVLCGPVPTAAVFGVIAAYEGYKYACKKNNENVDSLVDRFVAVINRMGSNINQNDSNQICIMFKALKGKNLSADPLLTIKCLQACDSLNRALRSYLQSTKEISNVYVTACILFVENANFAIESLNPISPSDCAIQNALRNNSQELRMYFDKFSFNELKNYSKNAAFEKIVLSAYGVSSMDAVGKIINEKEEAMQKQEEAIQKQEQSELLLQQPGMLTQLLRKMGLTLQREVSSISIRKNDDHNPSDPSTGRRVDHFYDAQS